MTDDEKLWRLFEDAAERVAVKADYADVLCEIARRASDRYDYERFRFFDAKAAAVRDCADVRVIPHRNTGHGIARPISCHVRGEPDCERARVARLLRRHDEAAQEATRPIFVSLTSRNAPQGGLEAARQRQTRAFARLRRRKLFAGGRCRWHWADVGPTGEKDGAPGHPCHPPVAAPDCRSPRCVPGCPKHAGEAYGAHLAACDRGCPTRTGLRQSHCRTHPPRSTHASGCPRSCPHAGHRRDRNCPDFTHQEVAGGISSFDLTWSEHSSEPWNVHLHMLLDAPWIAWAELRDHWRAITCQTPKCRHGRLADGSADPRCTGSWMVWIVAINQDDETERHNAIREVLKYVGKPHGIVDSLDPERVEEYLWALRGARLVQGWGRWRGVSDDVDEPESADELVIQVGFARIVVPRICPHCGEATTEDDWGWPFRVSRLTVDRLRPGLYGWRAPPALSAVDRRVQNIGGSLVKAGAVEAQPAGAARDQLEAPWLEHPFV